MLKGIAVRLLGAMAMAAGLVGPALADPPPTTVNSITDLAWNIRSQFAVRYVDGKVGSDWCFNVDSERGYSWWYYKLGNAGLTAQQVNRTVRIQAIYNTSDVTRAYSSVFMGVVVDKASSGITQQNFDLNFTVLKSTATPTNRKAARKPRVADEPPPGYQNVPVLQVPDELTDGSDSRCPSFEMFLNSYMLPNTALAIAKPTVVRDEESFQPSSDYSNARWWMFNGRGHQVFDIATYSLKATPANSTTPVPFTLVVGFGGGAGP